MDYNHAKAAQHILAQGADKDGVYNPDIPTYDLKVIPQGILAATIRRKGWIGRIGTVYEGATPEILAQTVAELAEFYEPHDGIIERWSRDDLIAEFHEATGKHPTDDQLQAYKERLKANYDPDSGYNWGYLFDTAREIA